MRMPTSVVCLAAAALIGGCGGGGPGLGDPGPFAVSSPDGHLQVTVERQDLGGTADYPAGQAWYYRVDRDGVAVLDWSPLGLHAAAGDLVTDLRLVTTEHKSVTESYRTLVGKRLMRQAKGNQLTLELAGAGAGDRTLDVVFRADDDGVAFRYVLKGGGMATMQGEATGFAVPAGATGWMAPYDEFGIGLFQGSYENPYDPVAAGTAADNDEGWQFPALFRLADGKTYFLMTESALDGTYCGSRLAPKPVKTADDAVYRIHFPLPGDGNNVGEVDPTSALPWTMPWRVLIIGDLATVTESTLVDDLAPPSALTDTSWIKPGRVAWSWLTQGTGDDTLQRQYLQFAKEMGWQDILIDAGWDQWANVDTVMPALVADAAADGVGIILWYNSGGQHNKHRDQTPVDRMLDPAVRKAEMDKLERWGVAGIKVDFFMSDKQDRIQQYMGILKDAAAHHLMVNFHGATIPRGWQRTYPNLMTTEAVRGAEYAKFGTLLPDALHRVRYVFTRNVLGSMDFTPVDFEDALAKKQIPYAGALALAVAFESGWQHFSDNADTDPTTGYRAIFAAFPFVETFMKAVPTVWDDTRLIDGDPDKDAIIARRSGSRWYVAGLWAGGAATTLSVPLSFLSAGSHAVSVIREGAAPDELVQDTSTHTSADTLDVPVSAGGGFVAVID